MYTAADIRDIEFSKNMGGYKAAEVDMFVDACAETVEVLTAEKDELSKKLSILADKLVEYRRDEDSIRSALLSAQRMGDSVVRDAKEQANGIIEDAKKEADSIVADAKVAIKDYEDELVRLKKEVDAFRSHVLTLYKEHLALLRSVPEYKEVATPVVEAAPVAVEPVAEEAPEVEVEVEQPVKSKFANLKFGEDYSLEADDDQDA